MMIKLKKIAYISVCLFTCANISSAQDNQATYNNYGANNTGNDYGLNQGVDTAADYDANAGGYEENLLGGEGFDNVGGYEDNASNSDVMTDAEGNPIYDSTDPAEQVNDEFAGESNPALQGPPSTINLSPIEEPNDFAGVPPVPGTLRIMAENEAPLSYTIREGDTLFDICDQLLDEPTYWPKLWSLNPDIKNPHFIWPGMVLRFYPGDDLLPPFLQVENEDELMPIDKGGLTEIDLVKAPLPEPADDPIYLTDPIAVIDGTQVETSNDDYIYVGLPRIANAVNIHVPVVVYGDEVEEEAVVIGGTEGEINLGEGQTALVEVEAGVTEGMTYTVLRYDEELENPLTGEFVGYAYQNVGSVKVKQLIEGGDMALVSILTSEKGVQKDDLLVGYISSQRRVPVTTNLRSGPPADATVVGFGHPKGQIASQGDYIVLDNPGLSVGSNVGLFRAPVQFGDPTGGDYIPSQLQNIGVAQIVDATATASVALILYASSAMVRGDRTSPDNLLEE